MELLYGTGNPAKLGHMRKTLSPLGIRVLGLCDVCGALPDAPEDGRVPMENAREKAIFYYRALGRPVFSCDSGLYLDGLPEEEQPGVFVRRVQGKTLDDDEMICYYSLLAKRLGGEALARYRNAVCFVWDEKQALCYDGPEIWTAPFLLSQTPHPKRVPGFPLDSLSMEIASRRYYYDLGDNRYESDLAEAEGFRGFFERAFRTLGVQLT